MRYRGIMVYVVIPQYTTKKADYPAGIGLLFCSFYVNINIFVDIYIMEMVALHTYEVEITRVIDGDTVVGNVHAHVMDVQLVLTDIYFRLEGIDTPEIRGDEKPAGEVSKQYLSSLILGQTVVISSEEKDKYGRQLGTIFFNGLNINQHMIDEGYAKVYE